MDNLPASWKRDAEGRQTREEAEAEMKANVEAANKEDAVRETLRGGCQRLLVTLRVIKFRSQAGVGSRNVDARPFLTQCLVLENCV